MASALVLRRWVFLFYLKGQHPGFLKNVFPPLEPKLLVKWEEIGEALHIVY
jgi:hypothetical protein